MIGFIVLMMLLGWLVSTAFMTLRSGNGSRQLDLADSQTRKATGGPVSAGATTTTTAPPESSDL